MKRAKLGLIGCGGIARHSHLPTIGELTRKGALDFVAVCDIDENRAKEVASQYDVPYYTDVEEMMERHKNMDVVDICTGDYTHHLLAKMAAEHKIHPIVEKPMSITLPCCDVMIEACKRNGVYFEVAENYFRMPADRVIVKLIKEGVIGEVMRVYYVDPIDRRPLWKMGSHSGVCLDMGVHRMSQIRLYAGSNPKRIVGVTKQFMPVEGKVFEDWGHAIIDFESGAVGIFECSAVGEKMVSYRQIIGTRGTIRDFSLRAVVKGKMQDIPIERKTHKVDGKEVLTKIIVHTEPQITYENPFKEFALDDWQIGIAEEIMSIADAALQDREPEYGMEGRKDVEMCIALYESSLKGMKPIDLPITEMTTYEKMVHEDFKEVFGYYPTEV
ncbi:TPA: Gfo/Idh/MocA family oxidoreductase [Candidatus Poribacteria bacterium]|nr:Gfo/Idh/MocA family oxidoreductase [Candidatus Poribacteria bacterium]